MASRKSLGLSILLIFSLFISQAPPAVADYHPRLTAQKNWADQASSAEYYILENELLIENTGSEAATKVRLEVPLMADLDSPYQEVVKEEFSQEPLEIRQLDNGNRIGVFSVADLPPGAETVLVQKYTVKVCGTNWIQDGRGSELGDPNLYLAPGTKIESTHPSIRAAASKVSPDGCGDDLSIAQEAFAFTRRTLTYDLDSPAANQGALAGLQTGSGCCEEYASLFVAVCRASGIPARIVNGYANDQDELAQGSQAINLAGRRHQWAEFYLDGKGWIPVDPTLSAGDRQVFGKLPAGCYVAENYGDNKVTGKYRGGRLSIKFQDKVARGY